MKPFNKILVPVDFSEASRRALHHAIALAESYDAIVHVLHVVESPRLVKSEVDAWESVSADAVPAQVRRAADDQIAEFLDDFGFAASERPDSEIQTGDPASAIVNQVTAAGYDLIVMGTHGRTGLSRWLVGSVAEKVVRRAACPVLTVREELNETPRRAARQIRRARRAGEGHS